MEVRELFYNVPARLKFLRSAAAERRQVLELCTKMALAQPHIAFRIAAEGKLVLATPGSGRLLDTILLVHGGNVAQELIKFQASYAWGQVQGYLGSPRLAKGNRSGQIFIMNGRVIQNQTLRVALEKAYHGLLPSRAFPWALLAVELRPELVDCNVHPAKAEVRFAQEQVMFSDILQAVRSGLSRQNLAPTLQQTETPRKSMPARTAPQTQLKWEPETWQHMDELLKSYRAKREDREQREQNFMVQESKEPFLSQAPSGKDEDLRSHLRTGRIIGQLHQTYILLEVPEGLWLLDQHIVHERILLEELEASFENATLHIQEILPQHLEFTPSEAALVEESVDRLREFGLELEAFGQNSFLLRAVPSTLAHSGGNWKEEILEIASTSKKTTSQKQEALITLACKGAVKAGSTWTKT